VLEPTNGPIASIQANICRTQLPTFPSIHNRINMETPIEKYQSEADDLSNPYDDEMLLAESARLQGGRNVTYNDSSDPDKKKSRTITKNS
jgi:hypothetical protein